MVASAKVLRSMPRSRRGPNFFPRREKQGAVRRYKLPSTLTRAVISHLRAPASAPRTLHRQQGRRTRRENPSRSPEQGQGHPSHTLSHHLGREPTGAMGRGVQFHLEAALHRQAAVAAVLVLIFLASVRPEAKTGSGEVRPPLAPCPLLAMCAGASAAAPLGSRRPGRAPLLAYSRSGRSAAAGSWLQLRRRRRAGRVRGVRVAAGEHAAAGGGVRRPPARPGGACPGGTGSGTAGRRRVCAPAGRRRRARRRAGRRSGPARCSRAAHRGGRGPAAGCRAPRPGFRAPRRRPPGPGVLPVVECAAALGSARRCACCAACTALSRCAWCASTRYRPTWMSCAGPCVVGPPLCCAALR